jgi:hypothetical protein
MIRVVLESPYAGDIERNVKYARECMADCLKRGEAPIASHLLYTQEGILDDNKPEERKKGICAGFFWGKLSEYVVVYVDLGWSGGMLKAVEYYEKRGLEVKIRSLYEEQKS